MGVTWSIIPDMTGIDEANESQANVLCKSCGLCCTGHLFIWVKLRPAELDPAEALGMRVFRSEPSQRGFSQPCPLWSGQCTIYNSLHYPHACRAYKCKLLKEVLTEKVSLPQALTVIEQAKDLFREFESMLPASLNVNFRERLVSHFEHPEESTVREKKYQEFRLKASQLLMLYEKVFGVNDLFEKPNEG